MNNRNFGQDKINPLTNILELCCKKVAVKFGNRDIESWQNSDYIKLSAILKQETRVYISENTLKRIFGKLKTPERYYPQKATRDALACFIGFRDWQEFETVQVKSAMLSQAAEAPSDLYQSIITESKRSNRWLIFGILSLMILGTGAWRLWPDNQQQISAVLQSLNPEGNTPHSAIFRIATDGDNTLIHSDYEVVFRDWKGSRSHFQGNTLTHYYELPGVYFPILLYQNEVIDTARIYLETNGWEVTAQIQSDTSRVYPISLPMDTNRETQPIITTKQILAAGVDTLHTFFMNYANIKRTTISGDNMLLETYVTTSKERPGVRCSQVDITLYGENDQHSLSLMKPECTAWCLYKFSEKVKTGKSGDLRSLGYDFSNGGHIKIVILKKLVHLYIDGNKVFELSYDKPIGKILGMNFRFSGNGTFSDLKLEQLE